MTDGKDYAVGICPFTSCQPDLHVWSSPKPQDEHLCHCGSKAWSEVRLVAGVDPIPVEPLSRQDLQALREALRSRGFTVSQLSRVVKQYPGTIKRLIHEAKGD